MVHVSHFTTTNFSDGNVLFERYVISLNDAKVQNADVNGTNGTN